MHSHLRHAIALVILLAASGPAAAQTTVLVESIVPGGSLAQSLELTAAQKNAIYAAVVKDKFKSSPTAFAASVGAEVPPAIELYALPDEAVSDNPTAKYYKYTLLQNQVVVVDPTTMRVVEVIRNGSGSRQP